MGTTERTEVYLLNDRLYPVTTRRPSGRGPWIAQHSISASQLVAIVGGDDGNFYVYEGPQATPDRVNDSILLHRGIAPSNLTSAIWDSTPMTLLNQISSRIEAAERALSANWQRYANEETMTGSLFGPLAGEHKIGRWTFTFSFVEFSKQLKEPITGTDVAIILDIQTEDGRRSFKTLWLQAKREMKFAGDPVLLPRFQEQSVAAERFTDDFYGIVYTPNGVIVTGTKLGRNPALHTVIGEAMKCKLGDTTIETLKNSLNRKHVFDIALTQLNN